jgi:hypothetical protein
VRDNGWRCHRNNQRIASQAPAERVHLVNKCERFEHFDKLLLGVGVSDPVTPLNGSALEQCDISREHHARIARSRIRDVLIIVIHERVEATESQERCELVEMHVNGKPDRTAYIRCGAAYLADIDRPERRIHRHVVTMLQPIRKLFGSTVDEYEVHLWMGHAERLERILHG